MQGRTDVRVLKLADGGKIRRACAQAAHVALASSAVSTLHAAHVQGRPWIPSVEEEEEW